MYFDNIPGSPIHHPEQKNCIINLNPNRYSGQVFDT